MRFDSNFNRELADAVAIAAAVRAKQVSAETVVRASLDRISALDSRLNCFTDLLTEQAIAEAQQIDQQIAQDETVGALAGVPFAVKNLFDVTGLKTLAGSKINQSHPPAQQDATAVAALKRAGAILVGTLNMDEYAYGFVTENSHYGATHNPHDLSRVAGGSSGGSAAAVAAGMVPLTLGSDTNGSIRVPAAFCGIFGLKPTYGRLSRAGAYLFASSLDHVGPFARSVRDIALTFDLMQGHDPRDPVCTFRPPEPCSPWLNRGIEGLRIAVADDYFARGGDPEVFAAVELVAKALGADRQITIPQAHRARAAAYVITASEGSNLHLESLKTRPQDFDPATRDRFIAGTMIPNTWYLQAQRFRRWYRDQVRQLFQQVDLILAPSTPCVAPKIGQQTMTLDGVEVLVRPNLGLYTQPLSFIGLPILSVPIQRPGELPVGVQIIAAPYNEALILRAAALLEAEGIVAAPVATPLT
ncbi:AtzE family amidohydrolase [Leptolyngbya sp. NK1-12]|uniref:AtzE family amidohydrolase n=1 Tax=Leptolyngbya sp. NK1-12 TaxID=2547451 RepID=A0AA96WNT2_9CYAN|nr:AtzE family amidohydrolase [Leptolyngbya sp. NK1-12]WNZ25361.1 AtzE family amidohydrolase [Leptolyngbya sp. NK1-12]